MKRILASVLVWGSVVACGFNPPPNPTPIPPPVPVDVVPGLQTHFGARVDMETLEAVHSFGYRMARIDAQHADIPTTLAMIVDTEAAGMAPLIIVRDGDQLVNLPEGLDYELLNEPDINGPTAKVYAGIVERAAKIALDRHQRLWVGVVSNLNQRGFDYLTALGKLPESVNVSVHRYGDNTFDTPHTGYASRAAEVKKLLSIIGTHPYGVSEFGYPTDSQGISVEQAAENIKKEFTFWEDQNASFAILYQLNDGPTDDRGDHYGIRYYSGVWKPAARVLVGPLQTIGVGITFVPKQGGVHVTVGSTGCTSNGDGVAFCYPVLEGKNIVTIDELTPEYYPIEPATVDLTQTTCGTWPNCEIEIALQRKMITRPFEGMIRVDGRIFRTPEGKPWLWNMASEFLLFNDYLDGGDAWISAVCDDVVKAGFNGVRVFGMAHWIPVNERGQRPFNPANYGDRYFTALGEFADALHTRGLYFEFTALADTPLLMPNTHDQRVFLERVASVLSSKPNAFLEYCNEPFDSDNMCGDVLAMGRVPGTVVQASGNGDVRELSDRYVLDYKLDYVTIHTPRDDEWVRKTHDGMDMRDGFSNNGKSFDGAQVPVVLDEPIGAADQAISGKRANNPNWFREYGAGAGLFANGGTFHSNDGIATRPWSEIQRAAAVQFATGVVSLPGDVSLWSYNRGGLGGMPIAHDDNLALRTFAKMTGGLSYVVVVQPQPEWKLIETNGFQCDPLVPQEDVLVCRK